MIKNISQISCSGLLKAFFVEPRREVWEKLMMELRKLENPEFMSNEW